MLEELISEIKKWEGSKGIPNKKRKIKELRDELNEMIAEDVNLKEVGGWILVRQYNPALDKKFWAIYSKESYKEYRKFVESNF